MLHRPASSEAEATLAGAVAAAASAAAAGPPTTPQNQPPIANVSNGAPGEGSTAIGDLPSASFPLLDVEGGPLVGALLFNSCSQEVRQTSVALLQAS